MKIFFDTEFTGLHKNTTLISLGMIDEDGRTFYAEFNDYDESQCDEWIHENVIKNLKWAKEGPVEEFVNLLDKGSLEVYGNTAYIKDALKDWLWRYDTVELVSDVCHYDMVLFIDIFGGAFKLPYTVTPACHDINQDIAKYYGISEKEAFDKSREEIANEYKHIEGDKHNSLYDAKVIKAIYAGLNGFLYMI